MPHSKQTQEQMRNKIVDMYQSGKGYKAISKALGLQRTIVRVSARGGPRGLKPRMFSEKPRIFLLPCPVRIIITEFSCTLKSRTAVYSRQEPPTEARILLTDM